MVLSKACVVEVCQATLPPQAHGLYAPVKTTLLRTLVKGTMQLRSEECGCFRCYPHQINANCGHRFSLWASGGGEEGEEKTFRHLKGVEACTTFLRCV